MKEFIGAFSAFLEVQIAMVLEFYGVIHAMEEAQRMRLTNVWLECDSALVCVAFTVRSNVRGCFVINGILVLIIVGKSGLELLLFFMKGNACAYKLANLRFIHRESFHWYNRLPSSPFLEFFMNRYSLPLYRFC